MVMQNVYETIQQVLGEDANNVTVISRFGGMTNLNYLVNINGSDYIVRMPGLGTGQLINRCHEKKNLQLGTALGINPQELYFDDKSGLKITEKIPSAEKLQKNHIQTEEDMEKIIRVLHILHNSGMVMENDFPLFSLMDQYEQLALEENGVFYPQFEIVKEKVLCIKEEYKQLSVEVVPCHIDACFENILQDDSGRLYLIDWEYSGMFDPLWDVATFLLDSTFTEKQEEQFVRLYFQRSLTKEEERRIQMNKIFQDYLWSLWTIFKEAKGDDFGAYGINRYQRLWTLLNNYEKI